MGTLHCRCVAGSPIIGHIHFMIKSASVEWKSTRRGECAMPRAAPIPYSPPIPNPRPALTDAQAVRAGRCVRAGDAESDGAPPGREAEGAGCRDFCGGAPGLFRQPGLPHQRGSTDKAAAPCLAERLKVRV